MEEPCSRSGWAMPEYTTVIDGHRPCVNVHGRAVVAPPLGEEIKAAPLPLLPLSPLPSSLPTPSPGLLVAKNDANTKQANGEVLLQNCPDTTKTSTVDKISTGLLVAKNDANAKQANGEVLLQNCQDTAKTFEEISTGLLVAKNDANKKPVNGKILGQNCQDAAKTSMVHNIATEYKNQLQQYAHKKNLGLPMYTSESEGPPHARLFKSRVRLDGKSYETSQSFSKRKEAEEAAAKIACQVLEVDVIQEGGSLYKNLLQRYGQKRGHCWPSYKTVSSSSSHGLVFVSSVVIASETFQGAEAKTKKQAEINAAKVAFCALTSCQAADSPKVSSVDGCAIADNLSENIQQPIAIIEKRRDATDEEAHGCAKRAKPSTENTNMMSNLLYSQVENSASVEPVSSSLQMPESTCVTRLGYTNSQPHQHYFFVR